MEQPISYDEANALLRYDPETGLLFWKQKRGLKRNPGDRAGGSQKRSGRVYIEINGHGYPAARLAWLLMTKEWPRNFIDHRDNTPSNNRWDNLREATALENARNVRKCLTRGNKLKGATWYEPLKKWAGKIRVNGRLLHLGYFSTQEAAHAAYCDAAKKYFGEFARAA
jgi:hypothetical protein